MSKFIFNPFKIKFFGNEVSLRIIFLSIVILGTFYVREKYFSLGNYFILPILTILISLFTYIKNISKLTWTKHQSVVFVLLLYIIFSAVFVGNYTFDIIASYFLMYILFYVITIGKYTKYEIQFLFKNSGK